jgi:putative transposase
MHTKTLKLRVRDKHCNELNQQARQVNFVWNYINELSARSIRERGEFLSAFDFHRYTKGANKELGLHSQTLQCIAKEYVTRRKQFKNGSVFFNGKHYRIWDSYGLSKYTFRTASFNEDSRGRWYFNVVVSSEAEKSAGAQSVGLDLGCKESVTDSNGEGVKGREYRSLEQKLGIAQRARNKRRVKAIHAKIRNRRHDALHKYSRKLVNENAAIFVGNVSSQKLIKTKIAKSVLDASWATLKTMLEYKCANADVVFEEINENYTTQTCSCCGEISANSPKGRAGLRIREWTCECGVTHHRDINAARNILALGNRRLAGEKVAAYPP